MDSMERVPIGGIDVQYALMAFGICVYEKKGMKGHQFSALEWLES